jgi:soluble lytic murein transglycosylase-like protein
MDQLFDPKTNLTIGARYFDTLSPPVERQPVPGGRELQRRARQRAEVARRSGGTDRPTSSWSAIPIRETRHYVKRVLGTFEMYRNALRRRAIFPDWSAYMPARQPREG